MSDYLLTPTHSREMIGTPVRTVAPTLLPVTVPEAKTKLQIDGDDTVDTEIEDLIKQAVGQIENDAFLAIMSQTWRVYYDKFPCGPIELRKCPVISVTSVKYTILGVVTTISSSDYQTDLISHPARIYPVVGSFWPTPDYNTFNAVQVEWLAGYATAALVPDYLKLVVLNVVKLLWYGCELDEKTYWPMINRLKRFGYV